MRLPEQKLWDRLSHLMSGVWQAQRIENRVGASTPDVFFAHPKIHGWIELKVYSPPVNPTSPWKLSNWTAGQQDWARRFSSALVPVWVVVHFSGTDRIYFLGASDALDAQNRLTLFEFRRRYDSSSVSWKTGTCDAILDALEDSWFNSRIGAAMASKAVGPKSTK